MLNQPGGQQKFNDLVTKLMQGALVNVDSTTQDDSTTQTQVLLQQVKEALKLEPNRRKEILKQAANMGLDVKGL